MADQYTRKIANILRDNALMQYKYWPALGGAGATGITLTAAAGPAWGALTDIVAAAAIATEFWVCGIAVYTATNIAIFELQLYNATLTRYFAEFKFDLTAVTANLEPMLVPFPVYMAGGTQVQGRAGCSVASKGIPTHVLYALGM